MAVMPKPSESRHGTHDGKGEFPDGGWGWLCVIGRSYCLFFALGMPSAFGILYIEFIEYYDSSRNMAAWIGSLNSGLVFLSGPIGSFLINTFGVQKTVAIGSLLAFTGCFASWFATGIFYLYVSYGVILGTGSGILFNSSAVILVQYFEKRRAFVLAVSSCGSGLGTLVLPPLYSALLEEYGWKGTLLITSGLILNCLVFAVVCVPPKYKNVPSIKQCPREPIVYKNLNICSLFRNKRYSLFVACIAAAHLGFFVPKVHFPDLVMQSGLQKQHGSSLVSIMGISSVVARAVFGWIADHPCVNLILFHGMSIIMCGAVTIVSPLLDEFYAVAVAAGLIGAGQGVFTAVIQVIVVDMAGVGRAADAFGLLGFLSGIMSLISSPLAGFIFDATKTYHTSFYLSGTTFLLAGVLDLAGLFLQRSESITKRSTEIEVEMSVQTVSPAGTYSQHIDQTQHRTDIHKQTDGQESLFDQAQRKTQWNTQYYGIAGTFRKKEDSTY